jgi:hypothetical protein
MPENNNLTMRKDLPGCDVDHLHKVIGVNSLHGSIDMHNKNQPAEEIKQTLFLI